MAIVNVNGISGINSITAQGTSLNFYTAAGSNLPISAATLNVGTGASVSSPATNVLTLGTNNSERVRVDSSGNIGLGTNTVLSTYRIELDSASSSSSANLITLTARNTSSQAKRFYVQASGLDSTPLYTFATGAVGTDPAIAFAPTGTEALRITTTGSIGIGTANPTSKLQVHGTLAISATDDLESSNPGGRTKLTSSASGFVINHNDNSATIFQNQGVERARIDSSGRLGIGTVPKTWTSGYNVLQVGSASLVGQSEQDGQTSNWSNNAYFDINDNRWEYSFADQASQITQSDGLIIFKTASTGTANAALSWTESARFNSSGNLAFPSGQGIDFSATTNSGGTMTSELLSDYEEGTFEIGVSGSGGPTITSQKCTYVKIGKLVTCNIRVAIRQGTATGNQTIVFLPFTSTNTTNYAAVGKGYWSNAATSIVELVCRIGQATTNMTVYRSTAAAATLTVWQGADFQAASDTDWDFTITYRTD